MSGLLDKINHALEACRRLDENLWSIDATRWAERMNPDLVEEIRLHIEALELEIMHHETKQLSDFYGVPVAYQYCYPDGYWRCSNGESINGSRPTASRALYARKDGK